MNAKGILPGTRMQVWGSVIPRFPLVMREPWEKVIARRGRSQLFLRRIIYT